jgi:hypothetical protein
MAGRGSLAPVTDPPERARACIEYAVKKHRTRFFNGLEKRWHRRTRLPLPPHHDEGISMNAVANQHCAHPACRCSVPAGEAYCSEHCRKRVESPVSDQSEGCHCGHPACTAPGGTGAAGSK